MTATTVEPGIVERKTKGTRAPSRWPARIAVAVIAALWTVPTIGLLVNSLRPAADIREEGWWAVFPNVIDAANWTLDNYRAVFSSSTGFSNAFINSIAVTIPAVVIPVTIAAFAAYAFAWMKFPGRTFLFIVVVALMVVPLQMALIPILQIYTNFEVTGTFPAVWLAHAGFGLPLAIYLLRNYMGSLPGAVIESAKIDGADHFTIFRMLIIPLSVPVLASFAIFQFLWTWNDYLVALVFLGTESQSQVLTVALANLVGNRGEGTLNILPAAAFVVMALPMVVFFALQRFFVRGLTAGSVKG
ncbi:MAG: carbohydrate ABC transporter permease [Acidimicrobiia bacterium]|nr:carbohydrate ABC transporter permease [Acidimicrobiia bacterium]